MPCCRAASRRVGTWMKTGARLPSERFARFGCDLDSGTQNSIVRATVKVASENKQRRGREAGPELKRSAAIFQGGTHFLLDPLGTEFLRYPTGRVQAATSRSHQHIR